MAAGGDHHFVRRKADFMPRSVEKRSGVGAAEPIEQIRRRNVHVLAAGALETGVLQLFKREVRQFLLSTTGASDRRDD
jgi:hypothetical protein